MTTRGQRVQRLQGNKGRKTTRQWRAQRPQGNKGYKGHEARTENKAMRGTETTSSIVLKTNRTICHSRRWKRRKIAWSLKSCRTISVRNGICMVRRRRLSSKYSTQEGDKGIKMMGHGGTWRWQDNMGQRSCWTQTIRNMICTDRMRKLSSKHSAQWWYQIQVVEWPD